MQETFSQQTEGFMKHRKNSFRFVFLLSFFSFSSPPLTQAAPAPRRPPAIQLLPPEENLFCSEKGAVMEPLFGSSMCIPEIAQAEITSIKLDAPLKGSCENSTALAPVLFPKGEFEEVPAITIHCAAGGKMPTATISVACAASYYTTFPADAYFDYQSACYSRGGSLSANCNRIQSCSNLRPLFFQQVRSLSLGSFLPSPEQVEENGGFHFTISSAFRESVPVCPTTQADVDALCTEAVSDFSASVPTFDICKSFLSDFLWDTPPTPEDSLHCQCCGPTAQDERPIKR